MKEFWIKNVSKKNVSLKDLALTVPAGRSYNLLSSHFHYTLEQLQKSAESGSLRAKSDKVKIRKYAPPPAAPSEAPLISKLPRPTRDKMVVSVVEPVYEELLLSDEALADEFSEE